MVWALMMIENAQKIETSVINLKKFEVRCIYDSRLGRLNFLVGTVLLTLGDR